MDGARDYRLMTRPMADAILQMQEYNRFTKGIYGWVGFRTKWIEFENVERVKGETKWNFWKLFLYSVEGMTAFSTAPLSFAAVMGVLFCFLAFVLILFIVIRTLIFGDPVSGWPSMVCIISLISGVQLFCHCLCNLDGGAVVLFGSGQSAVALVFAQVGAVGDRHPAVGGVIAGVGKGALHFFGDDIKNFFHILLHISEIEISPAASARPSRQGNRRKCRTCR